jgi:hypothetical protein
MQCFFCERKLIRCGASADSATRFGRGAAIGETVPLHPTDRLSEGYVPLSPGSWWLDAVALGFERSE